MTMKTRKLFAPMLARNCYVVRKSVSLVTIINSWIFYKMVAYFKMTWYIMYENNIAT